MALIIRAALAFHPVYTSFIKLSTIHLWVWVLSPVGYCRWFMRSYDLVFHCVQGEKKWEQLNERTTYSKAWNTNNCWQSKQQQKGLISHKAPQTNETTSVTWHSRVSSFKTFLRPTKNNNKRNVILFPQQNKCTLGLGDIVYYYYYSNIDMYLYITNIQNHI